MEQRQLTQKEIKRCIKALNWKYKTDHVTYWYIDESGEIQWREWEDGYHRKISLTDILFVKLWNRLIDLASQKEKAIFQSIELYYGHPYIIKTRTNKELEFPGFCSVKVIWSEEQGNWWIDTFPWGEKPENHRKWKKANNHPCLAFCEAIEELIATDIQRIEK